MRAFNSNVLVILVAGLFAWGASTLAAEKTRKFVPNKPLPTPAELGFIGVTSEELRATIKRLTLLPVQIPLRFGDRPDARSALENEVSRFLKAAGFEVIGSAEYQSAFDRMNREAGGIFDAATGEYRDDVARAVHQKALREVIASQGIDGYVMTDVVQASAEFGLKRATWDSVRDPTNHSGGGLLPALSLQVRIVDVRGKVLFARRGGIQLTGYSVPARGTLIPRVPPDELLRDGVRIERAARMATLPLSHSARAIFNGFNNPDINAEKIPDSRLPPQPPQSKEEVETFKVPRELILTSVKRIAIAPLDVDGREIPADLMNLLVTMVRDELKPLGWEIVEWPTARDVMVRAMQEARPFDPFTGTLDEARKSEGRKAALRALGADRVDSILWLSIERTTAIKRYGVAEWDGVEQRVPIAGPVRKKPSLIPIDINSTGIRSMPANSIHVSLTNGEDIPLFESRGGLQVLQWLEVTPLLGSAPPVIVHKDLHPNAQFGYDKSQAKAVHAALRHLSMSPEALAAEIAKTEQAKNARRSRYLTLEE